MTIIGTLFEFIVVCFGVMVMRKQMPDVPRAFKTPLVPLVPILGVFTCFFMMAFLPLDTWIRLFVWMIIGFDVYLYYGIKNSFLSDRLPESIKKGSKVVALVGLALALMLAIIAYAHHVQTDGADLGIYYFSLIFAFVHLITFGLAAAKK
jgi:APA family basic amino acid/polyamine antiporter